ncbi:uncharacterized protein [Amphiura filiformis]|uniref:uncharacterized protein isoform X2 n=1 Tax=Amphiura filiformis TaxID=82378 RepID=UPI003B222710
MMATKLNTCILLVSLGAVILCGFSSADVPLAGVNQDGGVLNMDKSWFNKTCKNIFCCIDGVLNSLNSTDICLRVEGYGCHLRYQLQKFADTQCIMGGDNKDTLMCHRNILDCNYDLGRVLLDTQEKYCSDLEEKLQPTLHCYRQESGSLTCEIKNNTNDLSACPDVAKCQYKKERVSCPNGWAPHRGHCYTYKEEPLTWDEAEQSCRHLENGAHLTDIKREEENSFLSFDLQDASKSDTEHEIWWTGLRRTQNTRVAVFQWADNTTFVQGEDFDKWGIASPETDVNHCVYVRSEKWFLAGCHENYGYTCKMPAVVDEDIADDDLLDLYSFKSLSCQHAISTTASPYTTQNLKKQTTPVISTSKMATTEQLTTKMMTTEKVTTKVVTTEKVTTNVMTTEKVTTKTMTTAQKSTNNPMTSAQVVTNMAKEERMESAKQASEELNNITLNLNVADDTRDEINKEMDKLTASAAGETPEASAEAVDAVDNVVDLLASSLNAQSLNKTSEPIVIQTEAMVVKVYAVQKPKECDTEPCSGPAIEGKVKDQTFTVDLPESLIDSGATLAISTVVGLEESMSTTLGDDTTDDTKETKIGSLITSIAINRWDNEPVLFSEENPLVLTFSVLNPSDDSDGSSSERLCSYWQPEEKSWSTNGCRYNEAKSTNTKTTCECTHLTSFAVIMQVTQTEVGQKPLPRSLDYLTYIGCGLSIFCLLLLILIFLIQKMHRSDRNIIHMNLALALLIAQVIFVLGIDQTKNQGACKGIAALLHYFLLATFFWMFNEAIYLLSKTTSARKRWLKLPFFLGVGWGSPAVIVGITLASAFNTAYDTKNYCWLQAPKAIWAFVGPAILIILINTGMLIKVIHVFLSLKANMNKKKKERLWLSLRAMLLTLPLLGTTWLVGIFSMDHRGTLVFAYIFVILNSLQGVFIFVLYCVMNDEVKKSLEKRMSIFSTVRSSMASTPGQSTKGSTKSPPGSSTKSPAPGSFNKSPPPGSQQTPQEVEKLTE